MFLFPFVLDLSVSVGAAKWLPHHLILYVFSTITMYHQCNSGTNNVPPLVMEIQTGNTKRHMVVVVA
jgi:hypothetical protein